jgi:hypothetical protein
MANTPPLKDWEQRAAERPRRASWKLAGLFAVLALVGFLGYITGDRPTLSSIVESGKKEERLANSGTMPESSLGSPVRSQLEGLVVPQGAVADHSFDYDDADWTARQYRLPRGVSVEATIEWYRHNLEVAWSFCVMSTTQHPTFVSQQQDYLAIEIFRSEIPSDDGSTFVEVSRRNSSPC